MSFWILLLFLLSPLVSEDWKGWVWHALFSLVLLSALSGLVSQRIWFAFGVFCFLPTLIFDWLSFVYPTFWMQILTLSSAFAFLTLVFFVFAKEVFVSSRFDPDLIFGAVNVYLILGFLFSLVYNFCFLVLPQAFSKPFVNLQSFFYFSFVTQTTLGFGDIVPVQPIVRNLAVLQAVMGQFYMATLVAGLVSKIRQSAKG